MDRYKLIKILGDGTYGQVLKAENRETKEIVAIKKMKKRYKNWEECVSLREVKSLRRTNHPNIVKLKEVLQVKDELMLVFEFVDLNLYQFYMNHKEKKMPILESSIKKIVYQVALGLDALHKSGYFHRDMKPENILVDAKTLAVKICDLGLAREVRHRPPFTEYVSTRWYRSPEMLLHSHNYNSPIDIFALGCIMGELYNLTPMFNGANELDQFYKIVSVLGTPQNWAEGNKLAAQSAIQIPKRDSIPLSQVIPRASPEAIELLTDMLAYDPSKRPTAAQIITYPYFKDILNEMQAAQVSADNAAVMMTQPAEITVIKQQQLQQQQKQIPGSLQLQQQMSLPLQPQQQQSQQQICLETKQEQSTQRNDQANNNNQYTQQQPQPLSFQRPLNPFQHYKDEYLKSQNMLLQGQQNQLLDASPVQLTKRILQRNNQQQSTQFQMSLPFNSSASTNELFNKGNNAATLPENPNTNNNNNFNFNTNRYNYNLNPLKLQLQQQAQQSFLLQQQLQKQLTQQNQQQYQPQLLPLGGTLDKPLNLNYSQHEARKTTRQVDNILRKRNSYHQNTDYQQQQQQQQQQYAAQQMSLPQGQIEPLDNTNNYGGNQHDFNGQNNNNNNNLANEYFSQFNKAINNNNSNPYYPLNHQKNASLPPEKRNYRSDNAENLNKMFEDKMNWAF